MCLEEVFIKKADVPDNAEAVCDDAELIGITEVSIDIRLLDGIDILLLYSCTIYLHCLDIELRIFLPAESFCYTIKYTE